MTKEEAIKNIKENCYFANLIPQAKKALDMAIEALEQEPFINKPCISSGVCKHDKNEVLNKIRAELIQSIKNGTLKIESGNEELFRIIDKYKEESEE